MSSFKEILLFPTLIHEYDFDWDEDFALLEQVVADSQMIPHGIVPESTYFTDQPEILNHPQLANLKKRFQQCVDIWTETAGCEPVEITNSWANRLGEGDRVERHRHELSVVSAAFYLAADEKSVGLTLESPLEAAKMFEHSVKVNFYNQNSATFPCRKGQLILFPSWVAHSTTANPSANRVTVSFNTTYVKWRDSEYYNNPLRKLPQKD
jgi:uncharacterized protein (TIGR02466 family)